MIYAAIVVDDKELMDFQKRFSERLPEFKDSLLKGISSVMRNAIRKTLIENKIYSSGELYESTRATKLGFEHYGVKMKGYAMAVENGSKAHGYGKSKGVPMNARTMDWCTRNGMTFWQLYHRVARKNIDPHPFLAKSFMTAEPMLRADFERRLNIFMKTGARSIGN